MTSTDAPPPDHHWAVALARRLLSGVLLMVSVKVAYALVVGHSVGAAAGEGAAMGAGLGVAWQWNARRANAFRARFEPTRPSISHPFAAVDAELPIRRYGDRWHVPVFAVPLAGFLLFAALAASSNAGPWVTAGLFALALVPGAALLALLLTYTEVGPSGLRIRTPRRRQDVSWAEVAQVRWDFVDSEYRLMVATTDGREVPAAGIVIHETGTGRKRADRALAHIEAAWSRAGFLDLRGFGSLERP